MNQLTCVSRLLLPALVLAALPALAQEPLPVAEGVLMSGSGNCALCHTGAAGVMMEGGLDVSPPTLWRSSMMANSTRDPLWQAKVRSECLHNPALAELIQTKCTRCHAPQGSTEAFHSGATAYSLDEALADPLARDGVSCTVCHQVATDNLGQPASFSGGFLVGDQHLIYGPYSNPLVGPMQFNSGYTPVLGPQLGQSELCATCHTLFTPWLDNAGQIGGTFPEQVPYLEWRNSRYPGEDISCQSCHLPTSAAAMDIATLPPWNQTLRAPFFKHELVGGNAWMSGLLRDHADSLGLSASAAQLERTRTLATQMLERAARLELSGREDGDSLELAVRVVNLSGHKLPTGIPLRRMWLRLVVRDLAGAPLFSSGEWDSLGRPPAPAGLFEPHHQLIRDPARTQIWEGVMGDADELPTWILLRASHFLKDNRLPPAGFSSAAAGYDSVAVVGEAATDPDFNRDESGEGSGADWIRYRLPMPADSVTVQAELVYQSVPPGLQDSFADQEAAEITRWLELSAATDPAPLTLARASWQGPGRLPAPRLGLQITGGEVRLSWLPVPGALSYRVWRQSEPGTNWPRPVEAALVGETTELEFQQAATPARVFYQVTALR
ncbi:MAG: hypothetical protein WC326_04780 [Candidatus Delongbacteria bacterium]